MDETAEKAASCLAITEKKAQRSGGCVGIFCHLFDWNKRLGKKKLFSRKLLPPVCAKSSKFFGGDAKMPKSKLQLIADENSRSFSKMRSGKHSGGGNLVQKHEIRSPSLVARLMGLESMPAVQKSRKALLPGRGGSFDVRDENLVRSPSRCERGVAVSEKGNAKVEPRPQKIQNAGQFEKNAVTKFGSEGLQMKAVFSRSKKHHSSKLGAPITSPMVSFERSTGRTSRLIDVATKILEPGLQATSKAKYALTNSKPRPYAAKSEAMVNGLEDGFPNVLKQSGHSINSGMEQISCKSCGNSLRDDGTSQHLEDQKYVYPQERDASKRWPIVSSIDKGIGETSLRGQERLESVASWEEESSQISSESNEDRDSSSQEDQVRRPLTSHRRDKQSPLAFKNQKEASTVMPFGRDKIPPRAQSSNCRGRRASSVADTVSGTKKIVASDKSLGRTRPREVKKVGDFPFSSDKRFSNRKDGTSSHLRSAAQEKRTGANGKIDSSGSVSSYGKRRNERCNAMDGYGIEHGACSTDRNRVCLKSRSASKGSDTGANVNKETGATSFRFSSPLRQKTRNFMENEGEGCHRMGINHKSGSHHRKLIFDEEDRKTSSQQNITLTGNRLGLLLEQKLKELSSQEEDELTRESTAPKRTTAMILQELLTALTAMQPAPEDVQLNSPNPGFQVKTKKEGTSVRIPCQSVHHSPGSVLEASFSNESRVSSSLDDSSGYGLQVDSMYDLYTHPELTEPDIELLNISTTLDKGKAVSGISTELLNKIYRTLCCINQAGLTLSGDKLIHAKKVLLNAELLFGNVKEELLLVPSLLHEDNTPEAIWTEFPSLFGYEKNKDKHQLKRLLFDCAVECLETRYSRYSNLGFKAWRSLPICLNSKLLMQEVRKWTEFAGTVLDELIEWEMSHSLGKWTDFDIQAFETGTEIGLSILESLVKEIVVDLWKCRLISC